MNQAVSNLSSRPSPARAVLMALALFAGLIVVAAPAVAETTCANDGSGELIVQVDEADSAVTTIEVRSGVLFVNGESCGTGSSILVADSGTPKADNIVFNLAAGPFRMNGVAVFVNLFLDEVAGEGLDEVTIRGTAATDVVRLQSQILAVARLASFPGSLDDASTLVMGLGLSEYPTNTAFPEYPRLKFSLRGGDDTFWMQADNEGHYAGFVSVRGGSGRDDLSGGPHRQRIRGGSGDDLIKGGEGNDKLWGNSGDDTIRGGPGNDNIKGGAGDDNIKGNKDDDTIRGGDGKDVLRGGSGEDEINGGEARDRVFGGGGRDLLVTNDGVRDRVRGGKGADTCDCDDLDNLRSANRV